MLGILLEIKVSIIATVQYLHSTLHQESPIELYIATVLLNQPDFTKSARLHKSARLTKSARLPILYLLLHVRILQH
jgi:cytosine/uracil/thiamine/allantoin permease